MAQLTQMTLISIEDLESQLGVRKFPAFVAACEADFQHKIMRTADRIMSQTDIRAIFVSGPTASGKTTFSDRLARVLTKCGRPTRVLSLDDYYMTVTVHHDALGRPDYETIDMLDTDAMVMDFNALFAGQAVHLPTFDFVRRHRVMRPEKKIRLAADDLIIIEGLHGLSELIIGHLPPSQVFGVFIMPWCTLLDGRQLLGSRDLRMLRRISRDVMHRGSTALSTIDYWPMIDHTEAHFFPPYLARADEYVNSSLAYEFCIIPPLAAARIEQSLRQYLQGSLPGSIYLQDGQSYADLPAAVAEAEELLAACSRLPAADLSIVPPESILQEFIH
ncbi:MAG: hypothetical protein SCM11_07890 [Bacillota bacterium]|nr:hypothetical protein [Bacillota bacterium]